MSNKSQPNIFEIGDTVWIFGRYAPIGVPFLFEAKIAFIKNKRYVAHRADGGPGEWMFTGKHYGKCVFRDRAEAEAELYVSD